MIKNDKSKGEIIIYKTKQGPKLDVKMEKQTVWLTQAQIGLLFDTERSVITKHINNIRTYALKIYLLRQLAKVNNF